MNPELGRSLQQARQERNLTLEQVSQETRIRLSYLQALEAGEFERLPSMVQARGFLRAYAGYLGIDPQPLLNELDGIRAASPESRKTPPKEEVEKTPAYSASEVRAIFAEIGQELRHQRETLGFSLEDVERQTRLRTHYLKALEAGEFDALPSPVQGRGMLNNYAAFLGLDPEPLLLRFAEGLNARLLARQATRPRTSVGRARQRAFPVWLRQRLPGELVLIGFVVILLAGSVVWGIGRIYALGAAAQVTPSLPSVAEALLMTPEGADTLMPTPTETPNLNAAGKVGLEETPTAAVESPSGEEPESEAVATEAILSPNPPSGAVQVSLVVRQRAWVRVIVDGKIQLEGRVIPGSAYDFAGEEQIELLTGNGAALQVLYNRQDLGILGVQGEVVHRIFTPTEILLPTPTPTPTGQPVTPVPPTPQPTSLPPTTSP
jgi:cytoskeletal protein RodZ